MISVCGSQLFVRQNHPVKFIPMNISKWMCMCIAVAIAACT